MAQAGRIGNFKPAKTPGQKSGQSMGYEPGRGQGSGQRSGQTMSLDAAEALAATALGALAEDPGRLVRFMTDTGLSPQDLQARAGERDVLAAVLEHVAGDESLLLVFTANANVKPETVMQALHVLQAPGHWSA